MFVINMVTVSYVRDVGGQIQYYCHVSGEDVEVGGSLTVTVHRLILVIIDCQTGCSQITGLFQRAGRKPQKSQWI